MVWGLVRVSGSSVEAWGGFGKTSLAWARLASKYGTNQLMARRTATLQVLEGQDSGVLGPCQRSDSRVPMFRI